MPHGPVLHPRLGRDHHREGSVQVLLVHAWSERRREHRWRPGVRSGDRHVLRRLDHGIEHHHVAEGSLLRVCAELTSRQLLPEPAQGQAQVMNTKTLVIYGTGRQGGSRGAPAQLFAVDKATGKQAGAVRIPSRTTAVPMTFMHNGKQYIVFAVGQGSSTSL